MLNRFFDHIYVLTLPRLKDRHRHIARALTGIEYELFFGVDKSDTSLESLTEQGLYSDEKTRKFHRYNKGMGLGMACCALGHVMIYRDMIARGFENALIFEDDIVPVEQAIAQLPDIITALPPDWELFYLGYEKNEKFGLRQIVKQTIYHAQYEMNALNWNPTMINNLYAKPISVNIGKAGYHDCTHAYAIKKSAAAVMLNWQTPIGFNPDNLLAFCCTNNFIRGYVAIPKLYHQLTAFNNTGNSLTEE